MYWNLIPQKTLNSTHYKYGHFSWIMSRDFQQCSTMAKHTITVTFCFGPCHLKSQLNFGRRIQSKKTEHHENPLFQYLSLFKTLSFKWNNQYQSCSCGLFHMYFQIQNQYIYTRRENMLQKQLWDRIFTLNPGQYLKTSFSVTLWKHSLNVVKCWALWNTWKSL